MRSDRIPAPDRLTLAMEARAPLELAALLACLPLLPLLPRGDGHPVLVFPGMLASDLSTRPLRAVLRALGYSAHGWQQGRNLGPQGSVLAASLERIRSLAAKHGRKVSLIGQSLGGIYARELAKQASHEVRCVITLGTPFTGAPESSNAWRLFEMLNGREHRHPDKRSSVRTPPPVPTTSIYSRSDGVVAWQCSVEAPGPLSESIEVQSSHTGMAVNPQVLAIVAERLAQRDGQWQPSRRAAS